MKTGTWNCPRSSPVMSSSPALRGGSSKEFVSNWRQMLHDFRHHPLRCGAVLRSHVNESASDCERCGHHPLRCGAVLRSADRSTKQKYVDIKSSSPALRGGSSKGDARRERSRCGYSVIIPCVAGRFFEEYIKNKDKIETALVIIPCVAGRFFEAQDDRQGHDNKRPQSSSPALRGGSSKAVVAHELRHVWQCHHPLRCGAVLRSRQPRRRDHVLPVVSSSPALRGGSSKP